MVDYILLRCPVSPPAALIHYSFPFPSDLLLVSLSPPFWSGKQEPEPWEIKRRYRLLEKILFPMCQRLNTCIAQHNPPDWERNTTSQISHFIQTRILHASQAVFGHPGNVACTRTVVIT